jgi:hypothetical protein
VILAHPGGKAPDYTDPASRACSSKRKPFVHRTEAPPWGRGVTDSQLTAAANGRGVQL